MLRKSWRRGKVSKIVHVWSVVQAIMHSHYTPPSEKLLQQTEGGEKEQEKCQEEVKELEDILPDLDSKVCQKIIC